MPSQQDLLSTARGSPAWWQQQWRQVDAQSKVERQGWRQQGSPRQDQG